MSVDDVVEDVVDHVVDNAVDGAIVIVGDIVEDAIGDTEGGVADVDDALRAVIDGVGCTVVVEIKSIVDDVIVVVDALEDASGDTICNVVYDTINKNKGFGVDRIGRFIDNRNRV